MCREADLAKFAKFQPDPGMCKSSVDAALALVLATRQGPVWTDGAQEARA
jgi:hypothetical protein